MHSRVPSPHAVICFMDFLINSFHVGITAAVCHSLQWALTRFCNIKVSSPRQPDMNSAILWQLQKPDGRRVTLFPNMFNSLCVFVNQGRLTNHICQVMEMIMCDKAYFRCQESCLGFFALLSPCRLAVTKCIFCSFICSSWRHFEKVHSCQFAIYSHPNQCWSVNKHSWEFSRLESTVPKIAGTTILQQMV